jgi:hypothetical protein
VKTLLLIIATGALLVAVAPVANGKNALQCSSSAKHSVGVRTVDPDLPAGYQLQRNLQYAGTWYPGRTLTSCKSLQSHKRHQKSQSDVGSTGSTSAGVTITDPPTGGPSCQLAPTGQTVPNPTYAPAGNVTVWACVGQTAAQPSAASSQAPAAPAATPAASSSTGPTSGYPPASANPLT